MTLGDTIGSAGVRTCGLRCGVAEGFARMVFQAIPNPTAGGESGAGPDAEPVEIERRTTRSGDGPDARDGTVKNQAKVIAAAFALLGFAVAILAGLAAGNPADAVLARSLAVMIVCQLIGMAAGAMLAYVGEEHVRAYEASRPIPDMSLAAGVVPASAPSGDEKISQNLSQRR